MMVKGQTPSALVVDTCYFCLYTTSCSVATEEVGFYPVTLRAGNHLRGRSAKGTTVAHFMFYWRQSQCVLLSAEEEAPTSFFGRLSAAINSNDPHSALDEDVATREMHDNAEVFDERTEGVFRYLQVRN